ncbi:MAG: AEC family transporter, partial [Clostridia bacterium]|nr:AEC family transporter [Clostridia bacterium]
FNSVAPIFLLVLFGMLLKKIGFLKEDFCKIADKFVFKVALPFELFKSVSQTAFKEIFSAENIAVILFFIVGITVVFVLMCLLVPVFLKDNAKCGSFIQGAVRGNFAIFALPLATNMFGEAGKIAATPLLPVVTIMFNIIGVVVFCIFAPKDQTKKGKLEIVKQIALSIIKNPLIIGIVIGFAFSLVKVHLGFAVPQFALKPISDVASCAVPFALISIGVNFNPANLKGRIGIAALGMAVKNMILPVIALAVAILMGFRGLPLTMVLVSFGSPTSVSSYIMAKNMHGDSELAGQILLLTTVCSLFTVFMLIFVLKQFAFI